MSTRIPNKTLTRKDKALKSIPNKIWRASKCKEGRNSDSGEILTLKPPGSARKSVSSSGLNVVLYLFAHQLWSHWGSSLDPHVGHHKCWPKTNRLPVISPAKWVYLGPAKNCNSGSAAMASHVWVLTHQGEENSFKEGKRKLGGLQWTKSPLEELRFWSIVAFYWLSCDSVSLAELLPGKRRKFFFLLLDSAISIEYERSSFWSPNSF